MWKWVSVRPPVRWMSNPEHEHLRRRHHVAGDTGASGLRRIRKSGRAMMRPTQTPPP